MNSDKRSGVHVQNKLHCFLLDRQRHGVVECNSLCGSGDVKNETVGSSSRVDGGHVRQCTIERDANAFP